jgi:hypothetical protein
MKKPAGRKVAAGSSCFHYSWGCQGFWGCLGEGGIENKEDIVFQMA